MDSWLFVKSGETYPSTMHKSQCTPIYHIVSPFRIGFSKCMCVRAVSHALIRFKEPHGQASICTQGQLSNEPSAKLDLVHNLNVICGCPKHWRFPTSLTPMTWDGLGPPQTSPPWLFRILCCAASIRISSLAGSSAMTTMSGGTTLDTLPGSHTAFLSPLSPWPMSQVWKPF